MCFDTWTLVCLNLVNFDFIINSTQIFISVLNSFQTGSFQVTDHEIKTGLNQVILFINKYQFYIFHIKVLLVTYFFNQLHLQNLALTALANMLIIKFLEVFPLFFHCFIF